jgi:hypothetical protein
MAEERGTSSALKGRLADVYVPALVDGAIEALARRLGNRATIDDPLFGRAATLSSIDPLLDKSAKRFKDARATYRWISSATGVDRDVAEGVVLMTVDSVQTELPIAVIAERRRLREIELRLYYATGSPQRKARSPLLDRSTDVAVPQIVSHVLEALRKGAVERVLAAFEEGSRWVGPNGKTYAKRDGTMAAFISDLGGRSELVVVGAADDGRTCCIEAVVTRQRALHEPEPAALSFERGDSGLLRELRLYYEPG